MNLVSNRPIVRCKLLKTRHGLTSKIPLQPIGFGLPYRLESPDNLAAYFDLGSCLLELYNFLLPFYCFDYLRSETKIIKLLEHHLHIGAASNIFISGKIIHPSFILEGIQRLNQGRHHKVFAAVINLVLWKVTVFFQAG